MAIWSALIKNIEYHKPVYRVTIDVKKDGVVKRTEVVDINDNTTLSEAVERIQDVLRKYEAAETIGANLNAYIGKEITL